jgi:hypothetical protein
VLAVRLLCRLDLGVQARLGRTKPRAARAGFGKFGRQLVAAALTKY